MKYSKQYAVSIRNTVAVNSIKDPGDAKVYSGVPLLTGIGSDKLFNDVVEYLKSQDS